MSLPILTVRRLIPLIVAIAAFVGGCEMEKTAEVPPPEHFPSSVAFNATTEFLSGSVVTTRLKSKRVISYSDQDSSWAYDLDVDFFDSIGVHTSALEADSALIREQDSRLDVFGHVIVTTDQGTRLESEHLAWNDSSRTISTDSFVVITRGDDVMSGYGFRSDPELDRIVFRRQVSGLLSDPKQIEGDPLLPVPNVMADTTRETADSTATAPPTPTGDDTVLASPPDDSTS